MRLLERVMGWCTAQCKMLLFCAKTIVKESHNFEIACLQKKKKERKENWLFGDFLVWYFHNAFLYHYMHVVGHEIT